VAATEATSDSPNWKSRGALAALTAAALALPGLAASPAHADTDGFTFNYQHYEEGERNLYTQSYGDLNLKPLRVDSLAVGTSGGLTDRVKFSFDYTQDTWSGATPVATAPQAAIGDQIYYGASNPTGYYTDGQGHIVDVNWDTYDGTSVAFKRDARLVHVMGSASPETRRQAQAKLGYEWDDAAVNLGGGVSLEPDYLSRFINVSGRRDLNHKLTTLNWGASYTWSDIHASLEANTAADWVAYAGKIRLNNGARTLFGARGDASISVGVTQVLNKSAVLEASLGYTRSEGYLANPYKAVLLAFDDPDQIVDSTGLRAVLLHGVLEKRPNLRSQLNGELRYVQYIDRLGASLHLDYRYYHDDWGIDAHTFDAAWYQPLGAGWLASAGVRYYSQSQANFYRPYFLFNEAFPIKFPRNPELPPQVDFSQVPITYYSSDERLSGFGTLSGRLAVSKAVANGLRLELGGEYMAHAGSLKLGGGGEGSYADFRSFTLYSSLKLDLGAPLLASGGDGGPRAESAGDRFKAPAGVMFDRVLDKAGAFSVGYRHGYGLSGRDMIHGSSSVGDQAIADHACGAVACALRPTGSSTQVSTLELMYAPTDRLTLLIAPEFVDRRLDVRPLDGGFLSGAGLGPPGLGGGQPNYRHASGGLGDTGVYALVKLAETGGMRLQAGLGVGAPTGADDVRRNASQDYANYDLQLGGGVWTLRPSLTWLGQAGPWSWGAQLSGVKRLENRNGAGYAFGDTFQATAWGGYSFLDWLSGSVRIAHTLQGAASGDFKPHLVRQVVGYTYVGDQAVAIYSQDLEPHEVSGPMDLARNQGGQYWDLGLGLSAVVPTGPLAGQRLSVEWAQPLADHVNGYQLKRTGTLYVSWRMHI
jgi:hypothetical protein